MIFIEDIDIKNTFKNDINTALEEEDDLNADKMFFLSF